MKPHVLKALGVAGIGVLSIFTFFITKNYVFDPAANLARVPEVTKPKREPVIGCMDQLACNFDPRATKQLYETVCSYSQYVGGGSGKPYLPERDDFNPPRNKPVVTPEPNNCVDEFSCKDSRGNQFPQDPVSIRTWDVTSRGQLSYNIRIQFLGWFDRKIATSLVGQSACDSKKLLDDRDKALEELKKLKEAKPTKPSKKP